MEQEWNIPKEYGRNYFKAEHKNQNVELMPEFKKWNENIQKYIHEENEKSGLLMKEKNSGKYSGCVSYHLLTSSFCNNCNCYTICYFGYQYSFVKCEKCYKDFCIGCKRNMVGSIDESLCLKGYLKLLYIRTIYRRAYSFFDSNILNTILITLYILLTPCYFGFVSYFIGFQVHQSKKNLEYYSYLGHRYKSLFFYSFLKGILMFPYILLFLPFGIVLLIISIFFPKLFFIINSMYSSAYFAGYEISELDKY